MEHFKPSFENLLFVAENMRQADKEEIYATRYPDDGPGTVAATCELVSMYKHVVGLDEPIAAFGAAMMWPGVWSVWMFATDDLSLIGLELTKFVRESILETVENVGAHRVECRSLSTHTEAHKWLKCLGFKQEGPDLEAYGKNRENFKVFVWQRL